MTSYVHLNWHLFLFLHTIQYQFFYILLHILVCFSIRILVTNSQEKYCSPDILSVKIIDDFLCSGTYTTRIYLPFYEINERNLLHYILINNLVKRYRTVLILFFSEKKKLRLLCSSCTAQIICTHAK